MSNWFLSVLIVYHVYFMKNYYKIKIIDYHDEKIAF